jgi:hypothetical protein
VKGPCTVSKSWVPIATRVRFLQGHQIKRIQSSRDKLAIPTNVVVEFVLEINEGGVRVSVKGNVAEDRPNDKRSNLRGLPKSFKAVQQRSSRKMDTSGWTTSFSRGRPSGTIVLKTGCGSTPRYVLRAIEMPSMHSISYLHSSPRFNIRCSIQKSVETRIPIRGNVDSENGAIRETRCPVRVSIVLDGYLLLRGLLIVLRVHAIGSIGKKNRPSPRVRCQSQSTDPQTPRGLLWIMSMIDDKYHGHSTY